MPFHIPLLKLFLTLSLLNILAPHAFAQNFNCQYQLQNWSDSEARAALAQWPQSNKKFILVQAGQVSATLDRAECSRLIGWLRRSEGASSAFQLTLYHGKHPTKIIPSSTQRENKKIRQYSTEAHRRDSNKAHQFLLTIGQETRISESLWQGRQDPLNLSSAELFLANSKPQTHNLALSRKPPREQAPSWLRIKPTLINESLFSFTVLQSIDTQNQLKLKIQQWQFDARQQRWLERQRRVENLNLSEWHNLDTLFGPQGAEQLTAKGRYSTQKKGPLKRFYFHIDKP